MEHTFEKKKLEKKFDEFMGYLANYDCWIAGGAITSMFTNREINDFDIYFKSKEELGEFIKELKGEYTLMSHTDKATLISKIGQDAQLIRFRYFDSAEEIFETFDFTVCMGAYSPKEEKFYLHDDFLKHNAQKILSFNPDTAFPYISMLRVDKYKQKGYHISKPELTKIMLACSRKKIETFEDAKDQLGGMYGNNISNLFKDDDEFSVNKLYDVLSNLDVNDSDFDMPNGCSIDSTDLGTLIKNGKVKVFKANNKYFKIGDNGIERIGAYSFGSKEEQKFKDMISSGFAEEINVDDLKEVGAKLYKYVGKDGDRLYSIYRNKFTYHLGEVVDGGKDGIYNLGKDMTTSHYYGKQSDSVLIELEVLEESNIVDADYEGVRYDKLKVLRIVPEEEYKVED